MEYGAANSKLGLDMRCNLNLEWLSVLVSQTIGASRGRAARGSPTYSLAFFLVMIHIRKGCLNVQKPVPPRRRQSC